MPRFPSAEWAAAYGAELNANPAYAEAARAWEGEVLLAVLPDAQAPAGEGIRLDLHHGQCRDARFLPDLTGVQAEFVYRGRRESWERLLRREIDPVRSLLDGTFKLEGNLLKAMRFQRAAKEMVETATRVPSEGTAAPSG